MAGESMSYPLRYGYSLVGRVAKCGGDVDPEKFLGKLVFAFSPHSSWVLADADGVMLVPEVCVSVCVVLLFCVCLVFGNFLTCNGPGRSLGGPLTASADPRRHQIVRSLRCC